MSEVLITTREGISAGIPSGSIDKYADRLRGELISEGHQAYDQARRVWNGNIDRRPALIARCLGVADVMASVAFAHGHDLLVAVRGGAHNAAGYGTCDGGLVIDLSRMKGMKVESREVDRRCPGGAPVGRIRYRNPSVRPRHDRRCCLRHGHCRAHARWRARPAHGQARLDDRQPVVGGPGNCRRQVPDRQRR